MQIINLIYIHNRPIENDPKFIGKSCDMGRKKCAGVIDRLIKKKVIFLTDDGKISKDRCIKELENVNERRIKKSKSGKSGANKRWEVEENQELKNSSAISNDVASTSTDTSHKKPETSTNGIAKQEYGGLERFGPNSIPPACGNTLFDIDKLLSDEARERARQAAPGLDQQELMRIYNEGIHSGKRVPPVSPNSAYPEWCRGYHRKRGGYS